MKTMQTKSARLSCIRSLDVGKRAFPLSMKKILAGTILCLALWDGRLFAQQGVGISESSITPDNSAILELRSSTRGFLFPRNTSISATVQGLSFFNTSTNRIDIANGSSWFEIPVKSDNLGVFASTTSAQLAGVLSDETGTGLAVFATSPTLTTPNIGSATGNSLSLAGALTAQATTNQLVLGTTNTITFSATAPTASRVITFPDPGATANVIYDVLTQTLTGAKTFSALATFNAGITSTGGTISLNASSNFGTNINTGTSTGAIAIGNSASTGITQNVGSGNFALDGTAGSTYTIGSSTTTGTITIGGTAQTGPLTLGSSSVSQSVNIGTGAGASTVNIANGVAGNTVSIANGNNTSPQTISIGAGTNAANNTINIGSGLNTAGVTSVTIGSNQNLANTTLIEGGNGAGAITLTPQTTGTIVIGAPAGTGAITLGSSSAAQSVNIGTGAGAGTINIGSSASTTNVGSSTTNIGIAWAANGDGIRFGNGRITMNMPTAPTTGLNANTTATVAQILNAGIIGFASTAVRTLTLPTAQGAAGLVQNLPGTPAVGDIFTFEVFNTGANNVTLVAGTGITIVNTSPINARSRTVYCRVTSVTAGAETISVY